MTLTLSKSTRLPEFMEPIWELKKGKKKLLGYVLAISKLKNGKHKVWVVR